MIIQALNDDHASAFLTLRLFGLRESPASFGSSYEEEHSRTNQQIVAHLVGSLDRKFLGCFNGAELVGVVGVGREQSVKERHIAFVRSMYVTPTARRQGVGHHHLESTRHRNPASPQIRVHSIGQRDRRHGHPGLVSSLNGNPPVFRCCQK